MTIIAAAIDRTGGYIASDVACDNGGILYDGGGKIVHVAPWVAVGIAGDSLLHQTIARGALAEVPDGDNEYTRLSAWWWRFCSEMGRLGHALPASGDSSSPLVGGHGLAVTATTIYLLGSDGATVPLADDCAAVGSGAHVGIGALYASAPRSAVERVEVAVNAACRYTDGCMGPAMVCRVLWEPVDG